MKPLILFVISVVQSLAAYPLVTTGHYPLRSLSCHPLLLAELAGQDEDLPAQVLGMLVQVSDHLRLALQDLHHLVWLQAPDHVLLAGVLHDGGGQVFPEHIWGQLLVVVVGEDVRHHQTDDHQGLQSDQAPQVVHLSEGVAAGVVTVAEIMEDHDNYHEDSIANREDVERSSSDILSPDIELKIPLQS